MIDAGSHPSEAHAEPTSQQGRSRLVARVSDLASRHPAALVGGLCSWWASPSSRSWQRCSDLESGTILAIAFVGPLFAYLILTGQLSEIGGGGFNVKFKEATRRPVNPSVQHVSATATQAIPKLGPTEIGRIGALDLEAPAALTLTIPPQRGQYAFEPLRQYIANLQRHPQFRFIVFLDPDGRAVGYEPQEVVARQLETRTTAKPFIDSANAGQLPPDCSVRTEFLTPDTTCEQALERMTMLQIDAMLVRDHARQLVGVVEREDLLARVLIATARG